VNQSGEGQEGTITGGIRRSAGRGCRIVIIRTRRQLGKVRTGGLEKKWTTLLCNGDIRYDRMMASCVVMGGGLTATTKKKKRGEEQGKGRVP